VAQTKRKQLSGRSDALDVGKGIIRVPACTAGWTASFTELRTTEGGEAH
jgi:hypothetical protein